MSNPRVQWLTDEDDTATGGVILPRYSLTEGLKAHEMRMIVREAVERSHSAGIRTMMITGDHPLTAAAIARSLRILPEGEEARILTGVELERMSDAELLAVMAAAPRGARLATLAVPTAVVHGSADPLLPPACGRDLAARIPAAELVELPGMGHDLPDALWPPIADAVRRTAARARSPEQGQG